MNGCFHYKKAFWSFKIKWGFLPNLQFLGKVSVFGFLSLCTCCCGHFQRSWDSFLSLHIPKVNAIEILKRINFLFCVHIIFNNTNSSAKTQPPCAPNANHQNRVKQWCGYSTPVPDRLCGHQGQNLMNPFMQPLPINSAPFASLSFLWKSFVLRWISFSSFRSWEIWRGGFWHYALSLNFTSTTISPSIPHFQKQGTNFKSCFTFLGLVLFSLLSNLEHCKQTKKSALYFYCIFAYLK